MPPHVPGYRLGDPLGFGSGSPVYSASDRDGRPVAVRVVDVDLASGQAHLARLHRLRGIDHPHVARIDDVVELSDRRAAVIGPVLSGPSLAALRLARGGLDEDEARVLVSQLGAALDHLHSIGLVHGDVSPGNVLATPSGWVLADVASFAPQEGGTPGFVAPERARGAPPTSRADAWSLAALVRWAAADGVELDDVVRRGLAPTPEDRPSAAEFAAGPAPGGGPVATPAPEVLAQAALRSRAAIAPTTRLPTRRSRLVARARPRPLRRRRSARHRRRRRAVRFSWPRAPKTKDPPSTVATWRAPRAAWAWGGLVGALGSLVIAVGLLGASSSGSDATAEGVVEPASTDLATHALDPADLSEPAPVTSGRDLATAEAAIVALLAQRDGALNAGSAAQLAQVSVPGSPAAEQDAALLAALTASGTSLEGLRTEVRDAGLTPDGSVRVVTAQLAHRRVQVGDVAEIGAQAERCLAYRLAIVEGSWRIDSARQCPP